MQLIDRKKCLSQLKKITKEIEYSNPNIKFRFKKNEKISSTYTTPIFDAEHNTYHIKDSKIDIGLYNIYHAESNAKNQIDVKYFDTHFLDTNGNPCYDAKRMLYELYKDKNDDTWYLPKQYRQSGFDNMIRNMETYKKHITQKTEDFGFPKDTNYTTNVFLHHPFYQNYRTAFDNATVGTERDHILLQVILREDPAAATIFKCLSSECNTYLNLFERTNQSNPAKVIPSKALHSPYDMQKTSKILHPIPKMSKSDKQRRNIDRIAKAEHICRNIDYADDDTSYNHDDFHV